MHQSVPTQDFSGILGRKCACQRSKARSSLVDDSSSTHVATNNKDKISNKQKVVVVDSKSSSSSNDEISVEEKVFSCSSCPRKFLSQQALAGHRNSHKSEWESLLDLPDHVNAANDMNKNSNKQKAVAACNSSSSSNNYNSKEKVISCFSFPQKFSSKKALAGRRDTLKSEWELLHDVPKPSSFTNLKISPTTSSLKNSTSIPRGTYHKPLLCASQYPSADSTNILEGQSASAHRSPPANPIDTFIQSLTSAPRYPLVKPTNTLIRSLPMYPLNNVAENDFKGSSGKHSLASPTKTLKHSLPKYPLANPTNTFKGPSVSASQNINSANTLLGPSIGAPHQNCVHSKNKQNKLSNWDRNHPLDNGAKPQGKSALGVRCESKIHKVCHGRHLRQTDLLLRAGSASLGRKQIMGDNIMPFGTNSRNAELRSLLTGEVSDLYSGSEGEGNSKAHDLFSSSFQTKDGKKIELYEFFPLSPAQLARQNYVSDHSPQGLLLQPDHNGVDVDLDLKL